MKRPFCHYTLEQIKQSGLLSPTRLAEVEQSVESRIHPVFLHTGKEIPNARFVQMEEGKGCIHPRLDDENAWTYARRETLAFILSAAELEMINKHCLSAATARHDAENFAKAEKLTEWDGGVFIGDNYHYSLGEALEELEGAEDPPSYVWAAQSHQVVDGMDAEDIAHQFIEQNGWEDMDTGALHGIEDLQAALDRFKEANKGIISYTPDHTKAILLPPET